MILYFDELIFKGGIWELLFRDSVTPPPDIYINDQIIYSLLFYSKYLSFCRTCA